MAQSNVDIFQILQTFSPDLAANNTLAACKRTSATSTTASTSPQTTSAYVGTYTKNINNLLTSNTNENTTLAQDSSNLVDVDMAKADFRLHHSFDRIPGGALYHVKGREPEHTRLSARIAKGNEMLVLSRKKSQGILIRGRDGDIRVVVLEADKGQLRLGIEAPGGTRSFREELILETKDANRRSAMEGIDGMKVFRGDQGE